MKEVLETITLWNHNPAKRHDKTYSVQLVKTNDWDATEKSKLTLYTVEAQYGRRNKTQQAVRDDKYYNGFSSDYARQAYENLIAEKRNRGYTKELTPLIPLGRPKTEEAPAQVEVKELDPLIEWLLAD